MNKRSHLIFYVIGKYLLPTFVLWRSFKENTTLFWVAAFREKVVILSVQERADVSDRSPHKNNSNNKIQEKDWGKYANTANMVLRNPMNVACEGSTMGWLGRVQHLFQPAVRIIRGYWFPVGTSNEFGTNRAAVPGPTATTRPAPIGVVALEAQAGILGQVQLLLLCYEDTSTA